MPTTPASLLVVGGSNINSTSATTQYWICATGQLGRTSVEADKQIPFRYAGVFSKLYIRIAVNSTTTASTLSLRKNASTVNLTLSIPSGTTGIFEDTTHTDTIAAGDLMSIQSITGATGVIQPSVISLYFANTQSSEAVTKLAAAGSSVAVAFNIASVSRFNHLAGNISVVGTEVGGAQNRIPKAGTLKNMSVNVAANARVNDVVLKSRINGADGTLLITIAAGTTGIFEDITHSDTVAEGDLADTAHTYGAGTDSISYWYFALDYVAASNQRFTLLNNAGSAVIPTTAVTNYLHMGGGIGSGATEADRQIRPREAITLTNMSTLIVANTITASSTLKLRKNGADGNLLITVAASTSGTFNDSSNSDSIAASDDINYQLITGATGTSLQIRAIQSNAYIPLTVVKTLSDTKTIGETSFTRLKKAYKTLSETETIGGTVARINAAYKALSQSITIAENVVRLVTRAGILKSLSDTIMISEVRARIKGAWRLQP